jgi:hypothetical protein
MKRGAADSYRQAENTIKMLGWRRAKQFGWVCPESIRRTRHIGDFRKWMDHDEHQKSLARLIRDLQAGAPTPR